MRGFILAAGFGTRLLPLTSHLNKAMIPLAGKPMLYHSISFLNNFGIKTIGVNSHHIPHQIEEFRVKNGFNYEIFFEKPDILGTAGALYNARDFLKKDDMFIVVNVDIVASFDLQKIIEKFKKSESICTLLAFENTKGDGTIVLTPESKKYLGISKQFDKKNKKFITADFIGFTLYKRDFVDFLNPSDFSITDVWTRGIKKCIPIEVEIINKGYWRDIGTPSSLAASYFDIIDGISPISPQENMFVNKKQKVCVNSFLTKNLKKNFGKYCWIESISFNPQEPVDKCIVFEDSNINLHKSKKNFILTKWGEIVFNE